MNSISLVCKLRAFTALFVVSIFLSKSIGQEDTREAQSLAKNFVLDADIVFDRGVFQRVEVDVETSADSPLLYTSKISLELFKCDEFSSEFFHSVPTIVSDDRVDISITGPPGSRNECWKRLYANNNAHDLLGPDLVQLKVPRQIPRGAGSLYLGSCVPEPYEWPFFMSGSMRKDGFGKKVYETIFGESHECIRAVTTHHGLESDWVRKDRTGRAVHRYNFRNDRLAVFEIFFFAKEFDIDRQLASDGTLLLRTETQWEMVDGDPYPSKISSIQYASPFHGQHTKYEATIKCFPASSQHFRDEYKLLKGILDKVTVLSE